MTLTRKLPDCPKCGEDELYFSSAWAWCVSCYLCGWTSDIFSVGYEETPSDAIERVVEAAKEEQT